MSPETSYRHRRSVERSEFIRTWRTVIDWVVALYLLIPGLLIAGQQYLSWWEYPPPWFANIPPGLFFLGFYLFVKSSHLRLRIREADQLFLVQKRSWMRGLIRCAMIDKGAKELWVVGLFMVGVSPLLIHEYHLSTFLMIALFIYGWLTRMSIALGRNMIFTRMTGWRQHINAFIYLLISGMGFVVVGVVGLRNPLLLGIAFIAMLGMLCLQIKQRLDQWGTFLQDCKLDQILRFKWIGLLLGISGVQPSTPLGWVRKNPWVFPQSGFFFPQKTGMDILTGNVLKALLRNRQRMIEYGQFMGFGMVALGKSPVWLGWCVWVVSAILLTLWGRLFWVAVQKNPFFATWIVDTPIFYRGYTRVLFCIQFLGFLPLSIFFGAFRYGWIGAFILPMVGAGVGWFVASTVTAAKPLAVPIKQARKEMTH
ncbi:ABC transporter permease [Marininema halotolerans]|uniref:ABC transporter protein EcsB n=1 Tax=Marininema halotolerans TaxID=1155944 RepID=A0A1I6PNG5_9BACL|nr:ABC transporter permease [Marininema halotolerans]SFS41680.1 ABC transporter protein EcsB [Marininema halotolerans]